MSRKNKTTIGFVTLLIAIFAASAALNWLTPPVSAQFVDRITRPCALGGGSGLVQVTTSNILLNPCTGGSVTINGVVVTPGGGGGVTGTGTTSTLPIWTDGAGGVLGDSPIRKNGSDLEIGFAATINNLYIGNGNFNTNPVTYAIRATNHTSANNAAGGSLSMVAGQGTGNAVGAVLNFVTPSIEASGSTPQSDVIRWAIDQTGTLSAKNSSPLQLAITGATQCLHVNTSGVVTGTGADCAAGASITNTAPAGTVPITIDGSGNLGATLIGTAAQFGGKSRTTDAAPASATFQAESAFSGATTNTGGANVNIYGGVGRRRYTVSDNTLGVVTVTTIVDGASVALVSGTDFTLGSDNTAPQLAVTATNLAAAINANGTLNTKISATQSTANVLIDKLTATRTVAIKSSNTSAILPLSSIDGGVRTNGSLNGIQITAFNFGEVTQTDNVFINATKATGSLGTSDTHQTLVGAGTGIGGFGGAFNSIYGYQAGIAMNSAPENSVFGANAANDCTTCAKNTVVGRNAGFHITTATQDVVIGWQAGFTSLGAGQTAVKKILIGAGDLTDGGAATLGAGNKTIGIGYGADSGEGDESQAYGYLAAATAANQLVFGGSTLNGDGTALGISQAYFGQGVTSVSPGGITINATGGSGTNNAGGPLTLAAGQGTGSAAGGTFKVKVSPAGGSGSSLNALVDALTIDSTKLATFAGAVSVTGHVTLEGVTSTGATGTGLLVFGTTPTLTTPVISGGLTASGSGANTFAGSTGAFLTSTGAVTIGPGAVGVTGIATFTPPARSSGVASYFTLNIPTDTGITAATESIGYQHVTATRTWATTGTVAMQRENLFAGPTYASASASQTFTDVYTVGMTPPVQGTNAIFTRGHTLGIADSTSAASAITGALIVANALNPPVAATSVGIGAGNINAGNNGTFGGTLTVTGHVTLEGVTSTGATGTGALVFGTSPTFTTSAISPLFRSTAAKVLFQGTGTGATQLASTQTTAPTCTTNCGTGSPTVTGSDSDMLITLGTTPASAFQVNFNGTWAAAPVCVAMSALASMVVGKQVIAIATTTTTATLTTNGTAPATADKYFMICRGTQ